MALMSGSISVHRPALTIWTRNVQQIDDRRVREYDLAVPAGPFVILAVGDTGAGMDEVTRRQIFEPFFTTKAPGRGTGLGLSTVYGIIKQSDGFITVESEVGRGTRFDVCLPLVADAVAEHRPKATVASASGAETILIVEDNEGLCRLAKRILESAGYHVLLAVSGEEALILLDRRDGAPVDLMITDVVLPGMNGRALADRVRETRPGMRVLYVSGYTSDAILRSGLVEAQVPFLNKPFTKTALFHKVREALDA